MTRLVVTLCLAVLAAVVVFVAQLGDTPPPEPPRPVPAWQQPEPSPVTPPPGASWCGDDDNCDQTR